MHVNDVPFLTSIFNNVHYGTIVAVNNMKCPILEYELRKILYSYAVRSFNIIIILVDKQFKSLKEKNKVSAPFNLVCKKEHVPIIEHYHHVIEEQSRCYYAILPYQSLPRQMVVELMKTVVFYVNTFIWLKNILSVLSPLALVEGIVLDYNLYFCVIYSKFLQTYKSTTNNMIPYTINAIAMEPSGNL
jgi:hypothetical protein